LYRRFLLLGIDDRRRRRRWPDSWAVDYQPAIAYAHHEDEDVCLA
jgi:hypothetical protein